MQQAHYNKLNLIILGLVVFCTIIASLVLVFFFGTDDDVRRRSVWNGRPTGHSR